MARLGKRDLATRVSKKYGLSKNLSQAVIDLVFESIQEELLDLNVDKITLPHLGTLKVIQAKPRSGRNPQTGEPVPIPARKKVIFASSAPFKRAFDAVRNPA